MRFSLLHNSRVLASLQKQRNLRCARSVQMPAELHGADVSTREEGRNPEYPNVKCIKL